MKKIKASDVIILLICALPICFQITSIVGNSNIYRGLYILIIIAFFILYIVKNKYILIKKEVLGLLFIVTIVYFIFPLLSLKIEMETVFYYIFIVCFIMITYISGFMLVNYNMRVLRGLVVSNGILLVYQILTNINEINSDSLMGVFNGNRFNRAKFGYSHPNFAAMFIVLEILFIYFKAKEGSKYKIAILEICILCIPLFSTGSRSAVYSLAIFIISEIIFYISSMFKKIKNIMYFLLVIILMNIGIVFMGEGLIENSSGRDKQIVNNIKVMVDDGDIVFGKGGGSISNVNKNNGIKFSDNWYMTCIINSGVCGLVVMFSAITGIFIKIFNIKNVESKIVSMFIMMYFYSLSENMLFVPGVSLSWFLWTCVMYIIIKYGKVLWLERNKEVI